MKGLRQVVTAAFACAALATTSLAAQASEDRAKVRVDNRNTHEIVVYAVTQEGDRYRLGAVNRLSTSELMIPTELADGMTQFRLKVYSYESSRRYTHVATAKQAVKTQPIEASAGETIRLLVAARLTESYIYIPTV